MATDINTLTLCGRLVAPMELRYTQSGYPIGSFTIAVNRDRKQPDGTWQSEASFFDCTYYGNSAKNLAQYLTKGKQVCIAGYLEQDRWEKEGQKFSRVRVIVTTLQFVGGNAQKAEAAPAQNIPQQQLPPYVPSQDMGAPDMGVPDMGVPDLGNQEAPENFPF